jgi:tetratricopeptide (TPR) repeat protein
MFRNFNQAVKIVLIFGSLVILSCKVTKSDLEGDKLSAQDNYELGSMYIEDGDFTRAIGQFILAINKDKNHIESYGGLGTAYFLRGNAYCLRKDFEKCTQDHNLAVRTYLQAIKLNKNFEYAYFGIGRVLFIRWQLEKNYKWVKEAKKYFLTAYKLNNKRVLTSYYLGLCSLAQNELDDAKFYLSEYLKKAPNAPNAELVKDFLQSIQEYTSEKSYSKMLQQLEEEMLTKQKEKE